jgi:hypothetical protein
MRLSIGVTDFSWPDKLTDELAAVAVAAEDALWVADQRPYGEIEKTISTRLSPGETAESFAGRCAEFSAWGIDHAVVITAGPWSIAGVEALGRVASQLD